MPCVCDRRRYVRSLEEDDPGVRLVDQIEEVTRTPTALLGRCRACGAWWERVPHYVYGYAWYQIEQADWDAADEQAAIARWAQARHHMQA
jgi:hypothetical protein